jgi:hypothetical protein
VSLLTAATAVSLLCCSNRWIFDADASCSGDEQFGDTAVPAHVRLCCFHCCNTLQTVIIELAIKRRNRITDTAFDELCKWHHASLPQSDGNYYPRSLWLMKKVAGVEDVRKIQVRPSHLACWTVSVTRAALL